MTSRDGFAPSGYETVGPKEYLQALLDEYGLTEADVADLVTTRTPPGTSDVEYQIHESVLRSHGEFACAGDDAALRFCREIAEAMMTAYGISREEATARINRAWSEPDDSGRTPRVWIVGLDIVYHESAEHWAADIYGGDPDAGDTNLGAGVEG